MGAEAQGNPASVDNQCKKVPCETSLGNATYLTCLVPISISLKKW